MRIIGIIIFVLLTIFNINCEDNKILEVIEKGNLEPINDFIYLTDLENANQMQLKLLRNTVYAKYGYIFATQELKIHFTKFKWYKAVKKNVEDLLKYYDTANIELIKRIEENIKKENNNSVGLIGIWYSTPIMPSGDPEHIHFYQNGIFRFDFEMHINTYGYRSFSGLWKIEDKKLILTVINEDVILNPKFSVGPFGVDIEKGVNGKKYVIPEKSFINEDFKIQKVEIVKDELVRLVIKVFDYDFYKYYDDPNQEK